MTNRDLKENYHDFEGGWIQILNFKYLRLGIWWNLYVWVFAVGIDFSALTLWSSIGPFAGAIMLGKKSVHE